MSPPCKPVRASCHVSKMRFPGHLPTSSLLNKFDCGSTDRHKPELRKQALQKLCCRGLHAGLSTLRMRSSARCRTATPSGASGVWMGGKGNQKGRQSSGHVDLMNGRLWSPRVNEARISPLGTKMAPQSWFPGPIGIVEIRRCHFYWSGPCAQLLTIRKHRGFRPRNPLCEAPRFSELNF